MTTNVFSDPLLKYLHPDVRRLVVLGFLQGEPGQANDATCEECGVRCAGLRGWYRRDRERPEEWICKCRRCALAEDVRQLELFPDHQMTTS